VIASVEFSQKALIRDTAGRLLLVRNSPDHPGCPGMWDLPGGRVEAGEGLDLALAREVLEETGLRVIRCGRVLALWSYIPQTPPRHPPATGPQTLRQQVTRAIRDDIDSGRLAEGQAMPSSRELAARMHVSVFTINGAMRALASAGYVTSEPRSKRVVGRPARSRRRSVAVIRDCSVAPGPVTLDGQAETDQLDKWAWVHPGEAFTLDLIPSVAEPLRDALAAVWLAAEISESLAAETAGDVPPGPAGAAR
jgi:8-oxo-dGTP pyrophosphatase MutT (NUDIX family)